MLKGDREESKTEIELFIFHLQSFGFLKFSILSQNIRRTVDHKGMVHELGAVCFAGLKSKVVCHLRQRASRA